jgi:hypothetical protein
MLTQERISSPQPAPLPELFSHYGVPKYDPHLQLDLPEPIDSISRIKDERPVSMMMALANYADHMGHINKMTIRGTSKILKKFLHGFAQAKALREDPEMYIKGNMKLYHSGIALADTDKFKQVIRTYRHAAAAPAETRVEALNQYRAEIQHWKAEASEESKALMDRIQSAKVNVPRSSFTWNSSVS